MARTIYNCTLIKKCVREGVGTPEQYGGVCLGYQRAESDDEPCDTCKKCKLNSAYADE